MGMLLHDSLYEETTWPQNSPIIILFFSSNIHKNVYVRVDDVDQIRGSKWPLGNCHVCVVYIFAERILLCQQNLLFCFCCKNSDFAMSAKFAFLFLLL